MALVSLVVTVLSVVYCLWFACILFVYLDCVKRRIGRTTFNHSFFNFQPIMWAVLVVALPIVVFPAYLIRRKRLIAIARSHPVYTEHPYIKIAVFLTLMLVGLSAYAYHLSQYFSMLPA